MKKALFTIACALGVIAGALLIWHVVIPVIGFCFEGMFGFVPALVG